LQALGKPTINNIGANGVNKKRVGQKEKGTQQKKKGLAQPLVLVLIF
jgi:hypothetical protein